MSTSCRPGVRPSTGRPGRGDDGFALVMAIAVTVVCLLLATTVVAVAVDSGTSTAADRARSQATAAAEAGIDAGVDALRNLDPSTQSGFSCTPPAMQVWSSPGPSSVTVTYAFSTTTPPTATSTVPCPLVDGTGHSSVTIRSTAVHTLGARTTTRSMSAVVPLNPAMTPVPGFGHALFSHSAPALSSGGSTYIGGDVYTNGGFNCRGSLLLTGTLTAQGGYATNGSCSVGPVRTSSSSPSPAVLTMPVLTFPATPPPGSSTILLSDLHGASGCTISGSLQWPSAPRVVDARSCSPLIFNTASITLRSDVTIYADSARFSGSVSVSSSGQASAFRLVVPARSTTDVCAAGGGSIVVQGSLSLATPTLLYTPGTLQLDSAISSGRGTLYGCQTSLNDSLYLNYDARAAPTRLAYAPSSPVKTVDGSG